MRHLIKSLLDKILAVIILVVFSPLLVVLYMLVYFNLGSPVLFKQKRPGLHGKIFTIYKFRTMSDDRDNNNNLLDDKARVTRFGKFLRSTSLDELPELFNIIKGDMSFVGPRPLLAEYLDRYTPEQARRHGVKPGITGWAQINGRDELPIEEKARLDGEYASGISFDMDFKCLFGTIFSVIKHDGIIEGGTGELDKAKIAADDNN